MKQRDKIHIPTIVCAFCGKEFQPKGFRNLTRTKFCSDKCRYNHEFYGGPKPDTKRIRFAEPRKCVECGNEFTPDTGHANAVTCSKECNILHQRHKAAEVKRLIMQEKLKTPINCKECGKEFVRAKIGETYCCNECRRISKNKQHIEYDKQLPPEVKAQRNAASRWQGNWLKAIERDHHTCQLCLSEGTVVHHLNAEGEKKNGKRQKADNDLINLITLCEQCHKDLHGVFLVCKDGKWYVEGKIFDRIGMFGTIEIFNKPEKH